MNKELRELYARLEKIQDEAKELLGKEDVGADEITAKTEEIKALKAKISVLEEMEKEERKTMVDVVELKNEKIDSVKAFFKALRGERLTDIEAALVTGGTNGENLLIPQDIQTKINELRREYKSARSLLTVYPTTTLTGSLVFEDISTITELVNFTDGLDLPNVAEPKFNQVSYSLKAYGGILPVSNTLLQNENAGLIDYLGRWFGKKATRTENKKIFDLLATQTPKSLADWKALKKSLNKDIDPALATDIVIVTNQDGFDYLDSALDNTGRPILQPDPTNPTQKTFMGYPVKIFSNAELPTITGTTNVAPIFYGALKEAGMFIDRGIYEFSSSKDAGFTKNQTLIRVIEYFDVVLTDASAYVHGQLTLA